MIANWKALYEDSKVVKLEETGWRIVEDQSRSSTRKMVDTASEHEKLEKMLEENKPRLEFYDDKEAFKNLHYLLSTPFKYPPLDRMSRFGRQSERGIFYASLELETAMCEKAYWRLSFLLASEGNIGGKSIRYTTFKMNIITEKGIDLRQYPFNDFKTQISSPVSYKDSHELGSLLREKKVEAFISYSARSKKESGNLNVFTPKALGDNKLLEKSFLPLSCYATKLTVEFYQNLSSSNKPIIFAVEDFYVDGQFPLILA